ncbi:autotransporter adhesin [Paraburkholderia sp. GAS205]
MPIAMAIGAAMLPGMAFAQAATGNGGLELCPGGVGGTGSSWGILSSSALNCNGANGSAGMSFSLNNGADTSGAWGFNDNAISARVTGYDDGRLVLVGGAGITMQDTVYMSSNNITGLAAGDLSTASTDAVNGSQLYQRTRYFQANSPSDDPSTDAKATGANSVASGPASMAIGRNSSAYGANTAAIAANSVALGEGSIASRSDSVSVGYLSADGTSQYTRQITNVTAGAAGTDAVNVNQLNAAIANLSGGGGPVPNAVTYDSSAADLITLQGAKGTKITNLTAGDISSAWSTDAVNGSQLYQTNQNVTNVVNNVANVSGNLANVTNIVNNIVNNGIAGSPLVVTYDTSARDTVTLGGVGETTAVKLTNVAAGDISSATSTDAVNGGQLYSTNQNVIALANNLSSVVVNMYNSGLKYFQANSALANASAAGAESVAIGGSSVATAKNSVALGSNSLADRENAVSIGSAGAERQIINVAAGTDDTDAVNVAQLNQAIGSVSGGGSADAVIYDTSLHNKLTLGGTGATTAVGLTNVAAGQVASGSKDAINGSQLYGTANSVAVALGGGTAVNANGTLSAPAYALEGTTYNDVGSALSAMDSAISGLDNQVTNTSKYIKVVSSSSAAIATGAESVAIGGGSYASGANSLAIGSGARSQFADSVAIGSDSSTTVANTISVGSKGSERRIMNVANGVAATDVATFGQLSALQTSLQQQITQQTQQSSGVKSMLLGATQVGATPVGATPPVTSYISVSTNVTPGTETNTDNSMDAMAIGPTATADGQGSLAVGAGSGTSLAGSTAIGSAAAALALNTTTVGAGASTSSKATNGVAIGYYANVQGVDALALGSNSQTNGAESVAMGTGSFVGKTGTGAMALGAGATVRGANDDDTISVAYSLALGTASSVSVANSVALGYGSTATRANTVSVGSSTAQRQIVNMAAGTSSTDAVNVSQLAGVAAALGGGAGVNGTDGSITKPSYTIGGKTYNDVASALVAVATGSSPDSVQYDTSAHDKVTLGGSGTTGLVTLSNVADGKANNDAVNVEQLKAMGANIDTSGNITNAFVSYDSSAKNKVTLGGAGSTTPVALSNVADGKANTDAVNVEQLKAMGANIDTSGNITNAFVSYDSSAKNKVTLGGAGSTTPVALSNVADGKANTDAVNVEQLKAMGANIDTSGNITNAFVSYDSSAKNKVTLGGAGSTTPVALSNVADGKANTDAVNVEQLKAMGANIDTSGNITNAFVSYDSSAKNKVTLGGAGSTTPVALSNVADGKANTDAVNVEQLKAMGANIDTSGNITNAFVSYDSSAKNKVTLGGAGSTTPVALSNVADGKANTDAVNVEQLKAMGANIDTSGNITNAFVSYDSSAKDKVTLGGAGTTTPVALTNVAAGKVNTDAVNVSQLTGVATALGGGAGVNGTDGSITKPTYALSTGTFTDVGSALTALDSTVGSINNTITDTTKYIKVVSTSSAAIATGGEAVAIGGGAYASGANSLAIGAGARSQFADAMALGSDSVTSVANTISVGSKGSERRIMNVANGVAATDVATFGQLTALQSSLQQQITQQTSGVKSTLLGATRVGAATPVTDYIQVSSNITPGSAPTYTDDSMNAMAIGPQASGMGVDSLAIGAGATTFHDGSTAIGSNAVAGSLNTTVIGAGASTSSKAPDAVAIGYMANAQASDAVALGSNSQTNGSDSVAMGSGSFVGSAGTNAMALGAGASVRGANDDDTISVAYSLALGSGSSVSVANSVALGAGSVADRANTVSVGAAGAERQIINVAAGTANTDAVNVLQLNNAIAAVSGGGSPDSVMYDSPSHNKVTLGGTGTSTPVALTNVATGLITSSSTDAINGSQLYNTANSVAAALGGNATVGTDGKLSKPAYALDGTTYSDVGAALAAVDAKASSGSTNGVSYDSSAHDRVTLGGTGASTLVTVSNVADGVANNDAVNVEQLKALGANIDSSGHVVGAFVAYDDTSKSTVTFGGSGANPVLLTNVAVGQVTQNSRDAINGSQLYGTANSVAQALGGNSSVNSNGQITKPSYNIEGGTYNDVGSAINAVAALAATGSSNGVVYDTSKHDMLTLGGAGAETGPVTVANVAAATTDDEAVNLKQLKDAGLNVDTSGNVTNAFVAYDNALKNTVTFNAGGDPTQLKNIAAATDLTDAVNFGQMQSYVADHAGSGGTPNAVAYDDSTKSQVTLGGVGSATPVVLTNVAAGSNATDAVNYSQFSSLESQVNNLAAGGGTSNTYVNIGVPADGTTGTAASAAGTDAIAIGNGAVASGDSAIAIGARTTTTGNHSVALGDGASASNNNSVALGSNSTTDRDNSVSVGSAGAERQITNVAAGTQATDAVNVGQLNNAIGGLNNSISNVDRSAAKGIASASALNIVTPYLPGRTTLNAGVANYRGFQALGIGVSRWNEKGTINYNLGVSTSGGNSTIVRAGIGIVLGN